MAKYKITKTLDFGPYTITGPSGSPVDNVPLNNYAPKVGDIINGPVVTKSISDGNGGIQTKAGIVWTIMTNGAASTQGQTSIQFIPQDYFEPAVKLDHGKPDNTIIPGTPSNPESPNNGSDAVCFVCENKWAILLAILVVVGLVLILSN